jgi:phosphoribosyl-ATP pyrophosphohydrolase
MAALVRHDCVPADAGEIQRLYAALAAVDQATHPRTARLVAAGRFKMAQKLVEEAAEVALAASRRRSRGVIRESADLIYQLAVLWRECGVAPEEIWGEMRRRADRFGLAEKLPKRCAGDAVTAAPAVAVAVATAAEEEAGRRPS